MIYNFSFAGATAIATPSRTIFGINKITLKNNSQYFYKFLLINESRTTAEMDAILKGDTWEWVSNVLAYAEFNNNLFAGNIGIDLDDVVRILVFRAVVNADLSTGALVELENDLDPSASSYVDWTAVTGKDYFYYVSFVDSTGNTSALFQTNKITSAYDSFFLIDPTAGVSYRFNHDASSTPVSETNNDSIISSPYFKYATVSKTLTQFDSGTMNCLLGYENSDCEYTDTVDYLDMLRATVKNTDFKYFKNRAGRIQKIQTMMNTYLADTRTIEHQRTISFNWSEIGAVNGGES
jgi:hypothetical protein